MPFFRKLAHKVKDNIKSNLHEIIYSKDEEDEREEEYRSGDHRHKSFAPVRHEAEVKYFVDGHDYCWAVSEAIENAKTCIFIEDWWLTPELYLRRPPAKYDHFRIDQLLRRKAEEGVKIYVVVYKEFGTTMPLDSRHTKDALQTQHENIIVQRHPDHAVGGTFFWSHHEKFVVIDNAIAFLGGLDLCFGRWDTHTHRLADFHSPEPGMEIFPGQDYSDARVRDFEEVKSWDMRLIDKTVVPRMPWHDISLCVMGQPVLDVARHFCERWNYVKYSKANTKKSMPWLKPPLGGYSSDQSFKVPGWENPMHKHEHYPSGVEDIEGSCRAQVLRSSADWSSGIKLECSIQTAYIDAIKTAQHCVYIENQFFITSTEEDPQFIVKNLIGKAIVERIIRAHEERQKFKIYVLIPLMPAFPADLITKAAASAKMVMHFQYISICRGSRSILEKLKAAGISNPDEYIRFYSLRSYDRINRNKLEEMLARAAGYSPRDQQLAEAGQSVNAQRGMFFHKPNQPGEEVRVPSFEEAAALREKYKRDAETVFKVDDCIASDSIAHNAMAGGDVESEPWVTDTAFEATRDEYSEREEAMAYVSEELYIHAKLMIVDDRLVIMGSANINDRSQCGERDSEIALLVEDQDMIPSMMNGRPYDAARFAATLRRQLWKEHLGLLEDQPLDVLNDAMLPLPVPQIDYTDTEEDILVQDPLSEESLDLWNSTASINTEAFRAVFNCVPEESVNNWEEYKQFYPDPEKINIGHISNPNMPVDEIRGHLSKIRGHLVEFPYGFLKDVDLQGESIPVISNVVQELYT
ncbi:hypothetical protein J3Q64DRAFT_1746253 [Phycomyces blakesleeanus]|uniref:phospholipase D n=1 Tax=Phycomyces blakesleeanus TaxID=4837 RepID=A0ABR3B1M1_PHYBL